MIKKIKIKNNFAIWEVDDCYHMADNESLIIEVANCPKDLICRLSLFNGTERAVLNLVGQVEVPKHLVFEGRLEIVLELIKGANIFKKCSVEPLFIFNFQSDYTVIPQIENLERETAKVVEENKQLKTAIKILGGVL